MGEMVFNDVIEKIGMAIDAAGVVVIVTGAAIAFVVTAVRLSRRESDVYRRFRQQLGRAILLGLELLVAGVIFSAEQTSAPNGGYARSGPQCRSATLRDSGNGRPALLPPPVRGRHRAVPVLRDKGTVMRLSGWWPR